MPRASLCAPLLAVSVAIAGCSIGSTELDIPKLEEDITTGVQEQAGIEATVECPDQVDVEAGKTFECDVTPGDGTEVLTAEVTMKDDEGYVTWKLV